jgi:DNA-binding response OmpR family regulator
MKVLVADDDPVVRFFLEASLLSIGHKVLSFSDGQRAFESFDSFMPDLVLSDWKMPKLDGIELCRRLREARRSNVHFILISSAMTSTFNRTEALAAGIDDFLPKPIGLDELWGKIRNVEFAAV